MAKNKQKLAKRPIARRKKTSVPRGLAIDSYAANHANMLMDPCNSILEESVYNGDRGFVNRFQAQASYGTTASTTAWWAIYKPGNQCSTNADVATATTASTLSFQPAAYPGETFMTPNASKQRAVACCITVRPNSAPNNATGTIFFGVVSASAVLNGASVTAAQLINLCSDSVSASQALMAPLEVRWSPGGLDERYNTTGTVSDDDTDRNALIVVGTGFPAASGVNYRVVSITEWTPIRTFGVVQDATATKRSRSNITDVVRVLKERDPSWWWSIGKKATNIVGKVAGGYFSGGAIGALRAGMSFM
jgi:hypothetical protein